MTMLTRNPLVERFGPRTVGIVVALIIEILIILLLLTLDGTRPAPKAPQEALTTFDAASEPPQPQESAKPRQAAPATPPPATSQPQPATPRPAQPQPLPPAITLPDARSTPAPAPAPAAPAPQQPAPQPAPSQQAAPAQPAIGVRMGAAQGPMPGASAMGDPSDTAVVGTAPDGQPLYAAAWYRKPYDDELRGYLSTANGPGWGLIACKTAPDYRVEDCVPLAQSPEGSNINRAILAAAWQFKVRPPRRGGKSLVGSWVRIRIDYDLLKH